ncbi:MAG: hypothetical protein IJC16_08460 [Rikenellaceae bacterium]|nr:hypothetical protein [Rikenellaceae bacterium]
MTEKKIDINTLENYLCDGMSIQNILDMEGPFEALRVEALQQTYMPGEDMRLNTDFRVYRRKEEEKFRKK